ncbi:hypothetical protein BV25DRAFT_1817992 [Artomyces pyxidatus]|uniref:Uncharacterized protein n=1 Tax=Artomyces pyxidatus TaxID=48021 RepID=A0ACB8TKV4_9AGAM|nr:hypothetical protein BV25DRAFT_1817992 [Artomyces pyxidatus]
MPIEERRVVSLTTHNLQSLTLANPAKNDRIQSFLDSQTRFTKAHALEGRAVAASWAVNTQERPKLYPATSGFDTPVLKPRVSQVDVEAILKPKPKSKHEPILLKRPSVPTKATDSQPERPPKAPRALQHTLLEEKPSQPKTSLKTTRPMKKRLLKSDTDEEHALRLADRRERKRAKRTVTKAQDPASSDSEPDGKEAKKKKRTKNAKSKKDSASKVPAGLALMHGFSSTNVGKNRLTIQPNATLGVFNKGRSSVKTKVAERSTSKAVLSFMFSEDRFLNNNGKLSQLAKAQPAKTQPTVTAGTEVSEQSSKSSSTNADDLPPRKAKIAIPAVQVVKKPITVKGTIRTKPRPTASEGETTESNVDVTKKKSGGAISGGIKSEPWDIELEAPKVSSESGASSSPTRSKAATAIFDVRGVRWATLVDSNPVKVDLPEASKPPRSSVGPSQSKLQNSQDDDKLEDYSGEHEQNLNDKPCSSLGPWESASQIAQRAIAEDAGFISSKYFARESALCVNAPAQPRETSTLWRSHLAPCTPAEAQEHAEPSHADQTPLCTTAADPSLHDTSLDSLDRALNFIGADASFRVPTPRVPRVTNRRPFLANIAVFNSSASSPIPIAYSDAINVDFSWLDADDVHSGAFSGNGLPMTVDDCAEYLDCNPTNNYDRYPDCLDDQDSLVFDNPDDQRYRGYSDYSSDHPTFEPAIQDGEILSVYGHGELGGELEFTDYRTDAGPGEVSDRGPSDCMREDEIFSDIEVQWYPQSGDLLDTSGGSSGGRPWRFPQTVHSVEADVARHMKDHWLPQKL